MPNQNSAHFVSDFQDVECFFPFPNVNGRLDSQLWLTNQKDLHKRQNKQQQQREKRFKTVHRSFVFSRTTVYQVLSVKRRGKRAEEQGKGYPARTDKFQTLFSNSIQTLIRVFFSWKLGKCWKKEGKITKITKKEENISKIKYLLKRLPKFGPSQQLFCPKKREEQV